MPTATSTESERFLGSPRWPSITKWMSAEEIANARQEWRQRCAQRYQRVPGEYPRLGARLLLVSWKQAKSVEPYVNAPIDEIAGLWSFVRGTEYGQPGQSRGGSGTTYRGEFELVPEPGNPHDHTALAVDLNGERIGYLSARYAAYHHWRVRALNVLGHRVIVPGFYRSTFNPIAERDCLEAVVLQPSSQIYDANLEDQEEQAHRIRELWDALTDQTRERIAGDGFHLTDVTAGAILELQELFPDVGLPTLAYAESMPRSVQLMLRNARHEQGNARHEEAMIKWREAREADGHALDLIRGGSSVRDVSHELVISETRIRKAMKVAGVMTLRKRIDESRDDMVIELIKEGLSQAAIAAEVGISVSALSSVLRRRGIKTKAGSGLNEWSRTSMLHRVADCLYAVTLQAEGNTRAEIAKRLGISVETVKKRLSDGHFFEDPETNLQRLDLARSVRKRSLTQSQCSTAGERRALTDGNVLNHIRIGWL